MSYSNFARRKGSKDKKKRKGSVAGTAAKALGGAALLAAGTRYGGAALLKRSATARNLAQQGLGAAALGTVTAGTKIGLGRPGVAKVADAAINSLGRASRSIKNNQGARATLRSDLAKVGNAVKAAKEKVKSTGRKIKNRGKSVSLDKL